MNDRSAQLSAAIAALESQRSMLGDAVVDTALAPLRRELAELGAGESSAASQRLKQVTVLFVDVVGSTAMGQRLEPEDIYAVMNGALARFTATVEAHYGRVLQYAGDGMLAVFGAEETAEDDVESAVLAGLAIIEESKAQADEVRRRYGVPDFAVRAGLHTGTVLLGGGVDAERGIRGATVNVAARMEQSAPAGRLRISHATYRHVRGFFDVSEPILVQVKGIEQPLRSYLVERAKPRAFRVSSRGIDGVDAKMVGRESELEVVRATFSAAGAERRLRALTIVGEAGIGKSRLLAEFQQTLDLDACWLLLGRAHPRSALHPYGVLRDMLLGQVQIGESDAGEAARQKLIVRLKPLFPDEGDAPIHLIGHLIGLDFSASPHVQELLGDDERFRERAFEACLLCLRRLGESRPVLVVLDDLHWADAQTLAFMRRLLEANRDTPLLTLIMTRPTPAEHQLDWTEDGRAHRRLELKPLDKEYSHQLAEALLQRIDDVPAALRAVITDGAEGNPFYMEELVKMLIDDGVIEVGPDRWRVLANRFLAARVPTTLAGVLQARLDTLGERERTALQHAAVVGHVFWDQALAAIDPAALAALPTLLRRQLVVRRDAQVDAGEYSFQHHLLHQVTYDGVLKDQRQRGHERVGAFWSARAEIASPEGVTPAACRALAEAHDHRRRADPQAFAAWFDAQFSHYLHAIHAGMTLRPLAQSVVELCERHCGPDHVDTARALTNLARIAVQRREMDVAEPTLRRALAIQERELGADHLDTARTVAVLGGYLQGRGDYAGAEPYFRRALEVRERVLGAEHPLTIGTTSDLAYVTKELGRLDEAERLSRRVLQVRERTIGVDAPGTASALTALGEVLAKKGDAAAAEPLFRRALSAQQQLGPDDPELGLTMWHLAEALRVLGRCDEAESLARRVLEIWEAGFGPEHEWTAWALICLAEIRLAQGDAEEAIVAAERAARIVERLFGKAHAVLGSTLDLHGRALLRAGRRDAAQSVLAGALEVHASLGAAGGAAAQATRALLDECRPSVGESGTHPLSAPAR